MIIDAHVHFWIFDPVRDHWINDEMKSIQRDFLPEHLLPLLAENGVTGCIAVQADQSEAETEFLLTLAKKNSFIKGVIGWIDLKHPDIEQKLYRLSTERKLKGLRHIAQTEPSGFLLENAFINGIKALKRYNYTYDILIGHHQLQDAIAFVDKLPGQPFVLDHCAKPNLKDNDFTMWKRDIKTLAQNQNVYCKLSGLFTESDWHNWEEQKIFNCFDVIFENFGVNRLMFASDWPVIRLGGNYEQWLKLVIKYTNRFNPLVRELVFSKNAQQFYKL